MKNIHTIKSILALFLMSCLCTSCEDWVETDYPSNQIGKQQVFEDVQTAKAALAGLYANLRDQSVLAATFEGAGSLLGSYADELDCYYDDQNGLVDIYRNQPQASNTVIERVWDGTYKQIYEANSIIEGTENSVNLSQEDKKWIKGEALFVRSLLYYYLQGVFGAIPYATETDYEINRNLSKLESNELLLQLQNDLTEAIALLEDEYRDPERIYPNRKVAQLLLAKVYLTEQKYPEAEEVLSKILGSSLYQFQSDINEVFHNTGTHILWQLKPANPGDAVNEASFYFFEGAPPNAYALTDNLVDLFAPNDLRKQNWIATVSVDGHTWYRPYKYKNQSGNNTNEYSIVFRLAETNLLMVEALAEQNKVYEALPYLNAIRERAGLTPLSSLSSDELIDQLVLENRKEFFTEFGLRFLLLKRRGQLNQLNGIKPNWQEYNRVLPLPQKELLLNNKLNPQNEGY